MTGTVIDNDWVRTFELADGKISALEGKLAVDLPLARSSRTDPDRWCAAGLGVRCRSRRLPPSPFEAVLVAGGLRLYAFWQRTGRSDDFGGGLSKKPRMYGYTSPPYLLE